MRIKGIAALSSVLIAGVAFAHHGSNGQFNAEIRVNVTGKVTKLNMVNPHAYVYFDVVAEDGETQPWRCEMRSGSMLRRTGWTAEMFAPGTEITIEGAQARREEFGCMLTTITFTDGTTYARNDTIEESDMAKAEVVEVELAGDVLHLNGNWVAPQRVRGARPPGGPGGPPPGGAGASGPPRGGPPGGRPSPYKQSEAGLAAVTEFNREMNPRFHCQPTNIFLDFWFDQHVNKIEQSDDTIVITYGFMDLVRTIHLDMDEHPSNIVPSRSGHSIGTWEDDVLVVDTVGFEEGWLEATFSGVKHSDQLHTVERFSVSEDGKSLTQQYVASDPLYLTADCEGQQVFNKTDAVYEPFNCDDLTEEVVDGF